MFAVHLEDIFSEVDCTKLSRVGIVDDKYLVGSINLVRTGPQLKRVLEDHGHRLAPGKSHAMIPVLKIVEMTGGDSISVEAP